MVYYFSSIDAPISIPDNNATGVRSLITVPAGLTGTLKVTVDTNITHTFRGDLVIQVIAPNGQIATLSNRAGGSADNFVRDRPRHLGQLHQHRQPVGPVAAVRP